MRFLLVLAVVAAALVLTAGAQTLLGSTYALVFAVAVIFSTGLFGLIAGLCAAAVAACTLDYFYIKPLFSLNFDALSLRIAAVFTVLCGCTHVLERQISRKIRSEIKPALGMHGSLDGLVAGELYGWAFDADLPGEPVSITAYVDRHPVANVAAVYYRPDVAETMSCSGRHGFYVDLTSYLPSEGQASIDVRLPNGQSLANAPAVMWSGALGSRPLRPTVLYMHIPKTAGTAFREALAANYLQSELAYLYPEPPGFLVRDLRALPLEQRRAFRMVIGHFQFWMHEALPQRSDYITIVREPGARVLSHFAYAQQTQRELVTRSDGSIMSFAEFCEKRLTVDFDNAMVRCFSGVDQNDFPPGKLTRAIFEQAVYHLRTAFSFVGHQETLLHAYRKLSSHYEWKDLESLSRVNVGRIRPTEMPSEEVSAVIRNYNHWDYLLYEEILALFPLNVQL